MAEQQDIDGAIEHIYSAAADPAAWQQALDAINALYPGGCTALLHHDAAAGSGTCARFSGWDTAAIRSYNAYYGARNPRFAGLERWPVGVAATAESMFDHAELLKTEFYNDFLRPLDLPDGLGVTLAQDHARFVRFSVLYPEATGREQDRNVAVLQRLTPHLQRAMQLNRQLQQAHVRWQAAEATLNGIVHGVFIVDGQGRILFTNRAADRILREKDGLDLGRDGVLRPAAGDGAELARKIRALAQPLDAAPGEVAPEHVALVRRRSERRPYSLLILPLRIPEGPFVAAGGLAAIFVFDPEARRRPALEPLARSFDLTRAETRLLGVLLEGCGLVDAATLLRISPHTAKTHLRHLFEKMQCSRQAEIVQVAAQHPAWIIADER